MGSVGIRLGWFGLTVWLWSLPAGAGPNDVELLPTVVPVPGSDCARPRWRRPEADDDQRILARARAVDLILSESVQDLGFTLDVSHRRAQGRMDVSARALGARAHDLWVISPRLRTQDGSVELTLVAVPPGSRVTLSRVEMVTPANLEVHAGRMLRDLMGVGKIAGEPGEPPSRAGTAAAPVERTRSPGRGVLALHSVVLGGYIGLSLQRASGSDDARLTYPLTALGAGMGLGASVIIADEWDIGLGDAWYLAAGAWWPAAAGLLLADGYDVQPVEDRYVYGLAGAGGGVTLATLVLSFRGVSEGAATLAHSGGAFGTLLGGVTQAWYEGTTEINPTRGMGYGAGLGVLIAGAIASRVNIASSRVLLVDLIAGLGGLTGAAAASPFVFGRPTTGEKRAWLASVTMGTVLGGALGFAVTPSGQRPASNRWSALPYAGVVASPPRDRGTPALGAGLSGTW
jgi:hypothetical protein